MLDTMLATIFHKTPPFSLQCYLYHLANTSHRHRTVCLLSEPIITFSMLYSTALILLGTAAEINTKTMTKLNNVGSQKPLKLLTKCHNKTQLKHITLLYITLQEYTYTIFVNSDIRNMSHTVTYFKPNGYSNLH